MLTAGTGAAIRDIHTTINSRYPLAEQIQINTLVQGEQAKNDIIKNIQHADEMGVDTIIIGRGGGSIEDLWNFNEEDVVKAIHACTTPIISAVGHETDLRSVISLQMFVQLHRHKQQLWQHQINLNYVNICNKPICRLLVL